MTQTLTIRRLGRQTYQHTWEAMKAFTEQRNADTLDELWCCEHDPVFTQGLAGKPEHILNPTNIPIIHTDRGGQVTYHGPGQLMLYTLLDIKRLGIGPRQLVCQLERSVMDYLDTLGVSAKGDPHAPGVYVNHAKIASIGLRIRRGCSYHGLALNVSLDTSPFQAINPCGFKGLAITQIAAYTPSTTVNEVETAIIPHILKHFGYSGYTVSSEPIKATAL